MLVINGRKFAKNDKEFTSSLFHNDGKGTCLGYYKVLKGKIILSDHNKEPMIALIDNKARGERFAVTCTKMEKGRLRYMFSTTTKHDQLLGFDMLSIAEKYDAVENAIESVKSR